MSEGPFSTQTHPRPESFIRKKLCKMILLCNDKLDEYVKTVPYMKNGKEKDRLNRQWDYYIALSSRLRFERDSFK